MGLVILYSRVRRKRRSLTLRILLNPRRVRGFFFFVVVYAVAVGAEDYALLLYLFVRQRVAAVLYQLVHMLLVGVVAVDVVEVDDGWMGGVAVCAG